MNQFLVRTVSAVMVEPHWKGTMFLAITVGIDSSSK
jgi:hypothetical protein